MEPTPNEPPASDEEALSDERLPLTELGTITDRLSSWRKRGAQLALLVLALCVGLAATWSALFPKRQAAQLASAPIPITALLVSNLTKATITFNGKQLAGHPPMSLSAYLKTDEITIAAPLFRPHTCHFKGLVSEADTTHCLFTTNPGFIQNAPPFIFGVYLTPDDLLPGQKDQIVAPLLQQLSAGLHTTTQPGDAIPTAFAGADYTITSQPAGIPLQASATLAQAGPQASLLSPFPNPFSPSCEQLICPFGFGPASFAQVPASQVWGLVLNVVLRWRLTDGTGATIADVTYPSGSPAGLFFPLLRIQFVYDTTGWHLAADTDLNAALPTFLCTTGMTILDHRVSFSTGLGIGMLVNRGVEGCLISVQAAADKATFLWRFGVLLSADAGAHAILPDLPIASPVAIAAVCG